MTKYIVALGIEKDITLELNANNRQEAIETAIKKFRIDISMDPEAILVYDVGRLE